MNPISMATYRFDVLFAKIADNIDFVLNAGKMSLLLDLNFIGGLSEVGVDSVELLIGDKDGT